MNDRNITGCRSTNMDSQYTSCYSILALIMFGLCCLRIVWIHSIPHFLKSNFKYSGFKPFCIIQRFSSITIFYSNLFSKMQHNTIVLRLSCIVSAVGCDSNTQFTCRNGNCIDIDFRKNSRNDCVDNSDEG